MNKISLEGYWKLFGNNEKERKINCDVKIPGDFHSALLNSNVIDDPYFGFNEKNSLWVGKKDWTIERDFEFSKKDNTKSILEIIEADTYFSVFINDLEAGKGQNQFVRYRFDITRLLKNGKNKIKIIFYSAEKKATELSLKLPYPVPCAEYPIYSPHRNMTRKCQCAGGWDWGPCMMTSGIYGSISILTVDDGLFDSLTVNYTHEKNTWKAELTAVFDSLISGSKDFKFSITEENKDKAVAEKTTSVILVPGKNTIKAELTVDNPHVWKTSTELKEEGLSENILYDVKISTVSTDKEQNSLTRKTCFNTLRTVSEKDVVNGKPGRSFYFENNGRKIFAKGSNWIPADLMASRATKERYESILKSAAAANINTIRVWAGGIYEREIFYETCDRLGLMIWQDCMFACSLYPVTEEFLKDVADELDYQVPRLQVHPCIALWCGNNENYGALTWFDESRNNRDRYLVDYDRLNHGVIGQKIKTLDPSRMYWPSSPCAGPDDFADNWHNDTMGDMHFWSVWHEGSKFDAYRSIKPRFVSEFGYESFPSLETVRTFASEDKFNFTSDVMEYHQRSGTGNSLMLENFSRYFMLPNGFANMVYLSQVQQALAIKTAVDYWRSLSPHCMGSIIWQLNDVWPGPSWSSIEYNGKWKLLHYELKKFYELVYMPAFIHENNLSATVCNDTKSSLDVTVTINYLRFDGSEYKKPVVKTLKVNGDTTTKSFEEPVTDKDVKEYFIYATMIAKNSEGKEYYSENTVFPTLYKHAQIKKANVKYEIAEKNDAYEITLNTDVPAFFVAFDNDELPGVFSENNFTLLNKKQKVITFTPKAATTLKDVQEKLKLYHLSSSF